MQTKKERKPLYALLIEHREIPLLAVLVLLLIAISIRVPGYIPKSYMNVLKNGSVNMVLSCGMLCVLLVGSIDISINNIHQQTLLSCAIDIFFHQCCLIQDNWRCSIFIIEYQ